MNNIHNKMEEIKREFSIFEDSREKYIYLVDIAKKSSGISPEERNDNNKVYEQIHDRWQVGVSVTTSDKFEH